jgi:hypothetical protein
MTRRWTTFFAAAVLVAATAVVGTAQQESIEEIRVRAEQGDAFAQLTLGLRYRLGFGVPQDDVLAYMWLTLAQSNQAHNESANESAIEARSGPASRLSPNQRDEAQRLAREWDEAHPRD